MSAATTAATERRTVRGRRPGDPTLRRDGAACRATSVRRRSVTCDSMPGSTDATSSTRPPGGHGRYGDHAQLEAAIAAKDLGSRELLDLYLDRVDRLNPVLNAVVTLDVDRARTAADAADAATARGESRGPLHGLPLTIKDAIEVEGVRSTGGAVELTGHVPAADAPAVARLKAAG